ncbi:MAG: glycosyltransferase [Bacteroidia bacterium]
MKKNLVIVQSSANANMISNFGRNISDLLQESGCDYHIIYSSEQTNKKVALEELGELEAQLHECPIPQFMAVSTIIKLPWTLMKFYLVLRKIKPDVIYTRGTLVGFVGRIAAKLVGVKRIYHHQDDFLHREEQLGSFQKWLFRKVDVSLTKITNKIFFVSDTILKEAIDSGIDQQKCIMVGHDLHPKFVASAKNIYEGRHPIVEAIMNDRNTFVVGSIARIEDFKGIDTIISVAHHFKNVDTDVKFLIRGNGSKREKYQAKIREEGLGNIVHLVSDYLPANEIPWLFKSFDVFFLPTRREGFGMVFAEAMCMGRPVVGPKIYPVVEVVPEGLGYLIEPENTLAYVEAIKDIVQNEAKRNALGHKAKEYALERWGKKSSAEQVVNVLLG